MTSACALAMFSGKIILNFGVQKCLRAFLNPIFTGRGRDGKRQLPRWFPAETAARRGEAFMRKIDFRGKSRFPLEKEPVVRYTEYNESYKKE